jgi:hypothetical protein
MRVAGALTLVVAFGALEYLIARRTGRTWAEKADARWYELLRFGLGIIVVLGASGVPGRSFASFGIAGLFAAVARFGSFKGAERARRNIDE